MSLRTRPGPRPAGSLTHRGLPPRGADWIHEIKFDGFRLLARREATGCAYSPAMGTDWTNRFPLITAGMTAIRTAAVRHHDGAVFLYAFDLLEARREGSAAVAARGTPGRARQTAAAGQERPAPVGSHRGRRPDRRPHACLLGLEGIVSKRKGSPYRSGRTADWIKCKNPASPAVKREVEED